MGGYVFVDFDRNGVKGANEPVLTNWRVRARLIGTNLFQQTFSDSQGIYMFLSLPAPATYRIMARRPIPIPWSYNVGRTKKTAVPQLCVSADVPVSPLALVPLGGLLPF